MRTWSVTARGLASVQVQGRNWIVALGRGLEELGKVEQLARLACEVLPNGTVIARDIASGTGYVVQGLDVPQAAGPDTAAGAEEAFALGGEAEAEPEAVLAAEEAAGEPIFELPAEAITALDTEDADLAAIDAAPTVLLACQVALKAAQATVPAESGAVILEEGGFLRFASVAGPASRKLMGVRLPMGTGVAGFAMEKRRALVLVDAHQDPRHCGEVDALTGYVTREIAVLPVVDGERVLGVLELMNLPDGQRFHERDVERVQGVADALARRLAR